ncbi:MAG TPA: Ig-like domain-containing protein, partial [Vicinamibacterales bacterium]|nr:Ig-like domain-containing protein [Vicinamibacterales bacterium]
VSTAPGATSFTFQVRDDGGTTNGGQNTDQTPQTMTVNVTPGPIPVASGVTDRSYTENQAAITVYPTIALSDADPNRDITRATITVTGFSAGDALAFSNDGSTMGGIYVASNAGGVLVLESTTSATDTLAMWQAALRAVTFVNTSDEPSTGPRQLSLVLRDDLNSNSSPANNVITVGALNDAPLLTAASPSLASVTEDQTTNGGQTVASFMGTINDPDGAGAVKGIAVTGTSVTSGSGTWQYSLDGTSWSTLTASAGSSLLLRPQDYIRFVPDGQNPASGSFTYRAWDQTSGSAGSTANTGSIGGTTAFSTQENTVSIAATAVNDAPTLSGNLTLPAVNEDNTTSGGRTLSQLLTDSGVAFQDVDSGGTLAGFAIVDNSVNSLTEGKWQYSTDGSNWFDVGTVADGSTALVLSSSTQLRFQPVADFNGTPTALSFRTLDSSYSGSFTSGATRATVDTSSRGGTTAIDATVHTIDTSIVAVNDVPVRTAGTVGALTVNEDSGNTTLGLGAVTYSTGPANESTQTITYTVTTVPGSSLGDVVLSDGTTVVTAGTQYTLAQIQGMQFRTATNASGSGTFTYTVVDSGGTANGGANTLTESLSITVNPVNDAPTGADKTVTTNEDTALTFAASDFGFADVDAGDTLSAVRIDTLPGAGTLKLSGVAVNAGDVIAAASLGSLAFEPALNANGNGYATFTFSVRDQTNAFDGAPNTITVNVTAVNDAPTSTNDSVTTAEDTPVVLGTGDFGTYSD